MLQIFTDCRTTRRLRTHHVMSPDEQLLYSSQRLMDCIRWANDHGHNQLRLVDTDTGREAVVSVEEIAPLWADLDPRNRKTREA